MKSQNNDVILICKRHYDSDKHKSAILALREYYKREYVMEEEFTTNMHILTVLLLPVAEQHFRTRDWETLLLDLFSTDYEKEKGFYFPADGTRSEIFDRILNKIMTKIELLQVRNNGEWVIDLSEYDDGEQIV